MYLRKKKTPHGEVLQLIESYRNEAGKPRNRVVISLGNPDIPEADWGRIARMVEQHLYQKGKLFESPLPPEREAVVREWVDTIVRRIDLQGKWQPISTYIQQRRTACPVAPSFKPEPVIDGVLTEGVRHESTTMLGPVLAGLSAWKRLDMDQCLKELGVNSSRIKSAVVSVINRLAGPVSEHRLPEWVASTSLPELLDDDLLKSGKDRYYRASDTLLAHQDAITRHLRQKTAALFSLDRTIYLYDLTNTYFEGTGKKNPKAKRGKSKEKRNDCPQVVVGMVLDEYGFELAHKVYEGNRSDSTTVAEMARQLQEMIPDKPEGLLKPGGDEDGPIVIMDGGLSCPVNRETIRDAGFHYLVNESRGGRKRYLDAFRDKEGFVEVKGRGKRTTPVFVKPWTDPDTGDRLLLCKSDQRGEKEKAMLSHAEERLVEDIGKLSVRIEEGRLKDPVKMQRAIGRIRAKNPRSARFYTIELLEKDNGTKAETKAKTKIKAETETNTKAETKKKEKTVQYQLHWQRKDEQIQIEEDLHGSYVLRTSRKDLEPEKLWKLYITLTRAEDGFRMLKGNLGLRPNFHQIEDRVDAHVFITILAYQLLQTILYPLRKAGDNRSWESICRVLETHCYTTIILPTAKGELHRIRRPGIPDERQRAIYKNLGIDLKPLPVKHSISAIRIKKT